MQKTNIAKGPKILFSKSIEEALPIIASAPNGLAVVVDGEGKTIGKVSLDSAVFYISNNIFIIKYCFLRQYKRIK